MFFFILILKFGELIKLSELDKKFINDYTWIMFFICIQIYYPRTISYSHLVYSIFCRISMFCANGVFTCPDLN